MTTAGVLGEPSEKASPDQRYSGHQWFVNRAAVECGGQLLFLLRDSATPARRRSGVDLLSGGSPTPFSLDRGMLFAVPDRIAAGPTFLPSGKPPSIYSEREEEWAMGPARELCSLEEVCPN